VALAPVALLRRIIAARTAAFPGLHRLAVDHRGRRAGRPSLSLPRFGVKRVMDAAPDAVLALRREVAMHRRARRELLGQHAPLTAGRK
jgi:hypothetical protein